MADLDDVLVGAPELGQWLGLTPRRIQQLVHESVLDREARGKYNLKNCVQAYTKYQDSQIMRTGASGELGEERLLAARLERKRKELEFAELQGRLITVDHHEEILQKAFSLVRANIRNLPGSLAPRLAGLDDPRDVQRILVPALDDALRAIVDEADRLGHEELPEDLPGRAALLEGGVTTISGVMSHPDLTQLKGIGRKTVERILAALAE